MAKSKSGVSPADVPPGMILVRSRAYGDHFRAKRGTYKKARLNTALKEGAKLVGEANAAAKLFKDAVDPYREGLIEKKLWSSLLSMFRRQQTKTGKIDFGKLTPFEFHTRYTLHKLLPVQVLTSFEDKSRILRAAISYHGPPNFDERVIDGYKLTAIVVFPDLKKKTANTMAEESAVLKMERRKALFEVAVSVPRRAGCFVLCLRIDGCSRGKAYHTIATRGMAVIAAGGIGGGFVRKR